MDELHARLTKRLKQGTWGIIWSAPEIVDAIFAEIEAADWALVNRADVRDELAKIDAIYQANIAKLEAEMKRE
jgi:hypothetical protein